MAASQPMLMDDLLSQIRASISAISPPAVLVLNIGVEGAAVHTTFRVSVRPDGSLVSLPICESSSSSFPSSPIVVSESTATTEESAPSLLSSLPLSSASPTLLQLPQRCSKDTAPIALEEASSPATEVSSDSVGYARYDHPLPGPNSSNDPHEEAEKLQRLVLHDSGAQNPSASPPVDAERSGMETSSSYTLSSPSDHPTVRHSNRTRASGQRLDCLVAASSQSLPQRRKRTTTIASTEEDSSEEEAADATATPKRSVRSSSSKLSSGSASSSSTSTPRKKKRRSTNTCNNPPHSDISAQDEVALLVGKLRAACGREASMEAVSRAAIMQLGREVLACDRGKEERCALTGVAAAAYQQQSAKIAVLISTSTSLRMVGFYLRAVLAARLKATHRTAFTEAARRLLGIKSTADISAYPAFYCFVQQYCPSVASEAVDVDAWLKEPVLVADITWAAWRRYLGKPHRWMLNLAMKQFKSTTSVGPSSPLSPLSPSSTLLSLSSSSSDATDESSPISLPLTSSEADDVEEEQSISDIDWELQSDMIDMQKEVKGTRRRGRDGKWPKPIWSAAMTVSGHVMDAATTKSLQQLTREHHRLTRDIWNSHTFHLAEHDKDVAVGSTNGEMRQAPFCELLQTLMTHPSIPTYAQLQAEQMGAEHFWLDVGSGYGLAVLRARIVAGAKLCAGIEIAEDRVSISHRLAGKVAMQNHVHFVSSDACSPQVLPILLGATHLFAFSAVFSTATKDYLANVLSRPDSSWLLYITCDKPDVLARAGIEVHTEPHGADCRLGGVHLLGHTKPLPMSVSTQAFTASIYLRCAPPDAGVRAAAWRAGVETLRERSEAAALQASERMDRILASAMCETRFRKKSSRTAENR